MDTPRSVSIIGDGQMGLVLADALAERGVAAITLWGPHEKVVDELRAARRSPRLPGFVLDERVDVRGDDRAIIRDAELIIHAIPSQFTRAVWRRLMDSAGHASVAPVVSVTKGIENSTLLRPTEVIADVISKTSNGSANRTTSMAVLSGPTIATELAMRRPAAMVAASEDDDLARAVQDLFDVPWLRVYRLDDPLGVELAGATKNIIALAAGMVDGLEAGDNAKSALLARGLAEIARLGTAMGAKTETFFGIAGVGDLATTCFSPEGRNRTCGERIGRGETLDEILQTTQSVVEGVPTTKSVVQLAANHNVEMPITRAVQAILFQNKPPREAIAQLMGRAPKAERI